MEEMEVEKSEPQKLETENQEKLVRKKRKKSSSSFLTFQSCSMRGFRKRTFHFRIMYVKSAGRNARVTEVCPVRRESEP